jgi:hypothetical protein
MGVTLILAGATSCCAAWAGERAGSPAESVGAAAHAPVEVAAEAPAPLLRADPSTAAHCARNAALLGANCTFATGTMARRVFEEGADWRAVGTLVRTGNDFPSQVASPVRTPDGILVIATTLTEQLFSGGHLATPLRMEGRMLEVDGVRYLVLTAFQRVDT